jgi:hypothetical protein
LQEEDVIREQREVFALNGFEFAIDDDATPGQRVRIVAKPFSKTTEFGIDGKNY